MTKVVKFWQKISFWNKLKAIFVSCGIGSEVALYAGDSHIYYRYATVAATVLAVIITQFFEDKDNNGKVDFLEKNL
jgi:endoglucanase Acf2